MSFQGTTRTDPHERYSRMRLLSWMNGVKANSGVWMEYTRLRKPTICKTLHPRPTQMMPLAAMNQHRPPEPHQPIAESIQAVGVSRYRVVVEVTLHDRSEPFAGERNRIVHAVAKLLLEFQQLGSHPLADGLALQSKAPIPVLPADMREAQKIKRLRFSFSSSSPVSGLVRQIAQTRSGAFSLGAVPTRTSATVPEMPPGSGLRQPGAETRAHCLG
jgi:hypothetical protein